jgi:hypothetical protein
MIIPHDRSMDKAGIPDLVLANYLKKIAEAKGDNIVSSNPMEKLSAIFQLIYTIQTVILDSCHSGSGTREVKGEKRMNRGIETAVPVEPSLYPEIRSDGEPSVLGRATKVAGGFSDYSDTSHMLLAACRSGEVACEKEGRGVFTAALLETFRTHGIDTLSYSGIFDHLKRDDLTQ